MESSFNADRGWVYGSLKRQKNISLRVPEFTSIARTSLFTKHNVSSFFGLFGDLLDKYHFQPSGIFNCDKIGISTVSTNFLKKRNRLEIFLQKNGNPYYCWKMFQFCRIICSSTTRRVPDFEKGLPPDSIVKCHLLE